MADWKTIEQRQGRQRRLRHTQEYGLGAAGIGGGLAVAAVRAKPTAFREAREIARPMGPGYGKFKANGQSIKVKVPLKVRSRAARALAQARPHGSVVLGGGLIAATGLGVAGTARGLEVWHQHKINDRRRRNMALQRSRGRVQKTYGGYSAIGKRYVEVSKGPVMVPTPVLSAAEKFKGVMTAAKEGFAGAQAGGAKQIAGQGTLDLGLKKPGALNSAAGAVGNAAGKATATPLKAAATAGTVGALGGMAASPRQNLQKRDEKGTKRQVGGAALSIGGSGGAVYGLNRLERGEHAKDKRFTARHVASSYRDEGRVHHQLRDQKMPPGKLRSIKPSEHVNHFDDIMAAQAHHDLGHEAYGHAKDWGAQAKRAHTSSIRHGRVGAAALGAGTAGIVAGGVMGYSGQNARQKYNAKQGAKQALAKAAGDFYKIPVRAGNPRYYDPEDRRQRRHGAAAGGLAVGGGYSSYRGGRRLLKESNKIKQAKGIRVLPVHGKGLAGVGIGGAAATAGLQIYRRGNDPRNKRWT